MARGSVFKRNNSYGFRAELGPDPATGRRRQVSKQGYRTKKQAEEALNEAISAHTQGNTVSTSRLTLGAYLDDWLEGQRFGLKETTWESYRVAIARANLRLGSLRLQGVKPNDLQTLYRVLASDGGQRGRPLSAKTIRNTHIVLRKALADAERLELIVRNPAALARPPAASAVERTTWSGDDLREFFDFVADDRLYGLWVLLATTGMRRGEALGLRWSDVDLDGGVLTINQTLTTADSRLIFDSPKTKRSRRSIYLDPTTVEALRRHRRHQREERLALGDGWLNRPRPRLRRRNGVSSPSRQGDAPVPDLLPVMRSLSRSDFTTFGTPMRPSLSRPASIPRSFRIDSATQPPGSRSTYSHVTPGLGREAADTSRARSSGKKLGAGCTGALAVGASP